MKGTQVGWTVDAFETVDPQRERLILDHRVEEEEWTGTEQRSVEPNADANVVAFVAGSGRFNHTPAEGLPLFRPHRSIFSRDTIGAGKLQVRLSFAIQIGLKDLSRDFHWHRPVPQNPAYRERNSSQSGQTRVLDDGSLRTRRT